jgi:fructokinase
MDATTTLPSFISFGEALTDLIRSETNRETWHSKTGGAPWNVARVMASWGIASAFAGTMSKDCFGDQLYQATAAAGLDMRFLRQVDYSPLLAIVHETNPPAYFFVGDNSADLHFDPDELPDNWASAVKWAVFGGISLARPPLADTLLKLAQQLKERGVKIAYDPNYRTAAMTDDYLPTLRRMTELADIVKVSNEDLDCLFHTKEEIAPGVAQLQRWNARALLCVTLGKDGAEAYLGNERWAFAPPSLEDEQKEPGANTVGAGDAFLGGLIYHDMKHPDGDPRQQLAFAVATGTAACLTASAAPPRMEVVQAIFKKMLTTEDGDR